MAGLLECRSSTIVDRPTETLCAVCGTIFNQPVRAQGGGRRSIYCSGKCRSLDWIRGNGGKRKASVLKYDNKPVNKTKKILRTRRTTLRRHGLVEADFQAMLTRQRGHCLGCNCTLSTKTLRIDHDHLTDRVRGLICNNCNLALGLVRDDRARLYQLAAYLELDRTKPVVYLIGSLRNPKVVHVGNAIRGLGMECIDNWHAAGKIADDAWRDYSHAQNKTYKEALDSREAKHIYHFDKAYLNLCDVVVLLYPAGKSAHIELGYAVGLGVPRSYILLEDVPHRYDVMTQFATSIFFDLENLLTALKADYNIVD